MVYYYDFFFLKGKLHLSIDSRNYSHLTHQHITQANSNPLYGVILVFHGSLQ